MQIAWQPTCNLELLRLRARLLQNIRVFFQQRDVLEVETPLLSQTIGTDPQLAFFSSTYDAPPLQQSLFLQTSPEFAMKRLLAAGSGSIYQICKAFRNGEAGRFHNPEFTILEWYRVGFDLTQLMDDIEDLMSLLFNNTLQPTQRISYQDVFYRYTGLNALQFSYADYCQYARENQLAEAINLCENDHALWLDFLFSHAVQPFLSDNALCLVYGYPACQSSLARLNAENPLITDRVELFINGVELGNGFYELTDAQEQERRFDAELQERQLKHLPPTVKDSRLLAALTAGLPDCAGVAIGIDRLLLVLSNSASLEQVLSFPLHRA